MPQRSTGTSDQEADDAWVNELVASLPAPHSIEGVFRWAFFIDSLGLAFMPRETQVKRYGVQEWLPTDRPWRKDEIGAALKQAHQRILERFSVPAAEPK